MATADVLRRMRADDVPAVMEVQEPTSVAGLSGVFPQDAHPFPREVLAGRWREEIADPTIECFVIERAGPRSCLVRDRPRRRGLSPALGGNEGRTSRR